MTSLLIKMDVFRCPVSAGLNFRGTKLSRIAGEPRKPRKFSTAKIKVHTVDSCSLLLLGYELVLKHISMRVSLILHLVQKL